MSRKLQLPGVRQGFASISSIVPLGMLPALLTRMSISVQSAISFSRSGRHAEIERDGTDIDRRDLAQFGRRFLKLLGRARGEAQIGRPPRPGASPPQTRSRASRR